MGNTDGNLVMMLCFSSAAASFFSSAVVLVGLSTFVDSYTRNFSSFSPDLACAQLIIHPIPCCPFLQNPAGFAKKNSVLRRDLSLPFDPLFPLVTSTALTNNVVLGTTASVNFKHNSYATATRINRSRERA